MAGIWKVQYVTHIHVTISHKVHYVIRSWCNISHAASVTHSQCNMWHTVSAICDTHLVQYMWHAAVVICDTHPVQHVQHIHSIMWHTYMWHTSSAICDKQPVHYVTHSQCNMWHTASDICDTQHSPIFNANLIQPWIVILYTSDTHTIKVDLRKYFSITGTSIQAV